MPVAEHGLDREPRIGDRPEQEGDLDLAAAESIPRLGRRRLGKVQPYTVRLEIEAEAV